MGWGGDRQETFEVETGDVSRRRSSGKSLSEPDNERRRVDGVERDERGDTLQTKVLGGTVPETPGCRLPPVGLPESPPSTLNRVPCPGTSRNDSWSQTGRVPTGRVSPVDAVSDTTGPRARDTQVDLTPQEWHKRLNKGGPIKEPETCTSDDIY